MKYICLSFLIFLTTLSAASAHAGTAFKCQDSSGTYGFEGFYHGESTDIVELRTSSVLAIQDHESNSGSLMLKRDRDFSEADVDGYDLVFVSKQKSDLGNFMTVFAMPMGVFGGNIIGKRFQILLITNLRYTLMCKIVEAVDL